MEEYLIIKNGLVLTLDRAGKTGYYTIIIKNGKIFLIDYDNNFNEKEFTIKNPGSVIIDATGKIVMPGLFNSKLISSYSFSRYFFKKCDYENLNNWLSLKLIDRYLLQDANNKFMKELLDISYSRSLQSGELFICESGTGISRDFFEKFFSDTDRIRQYFNISVYDYSLLKNLSGQERFISVGYKANEDINNYSLTSVKKAMSDQKPLLFFDASLSQKTIDSIKKVFGKPFISVLSEMEMISQGTVISNPTHLSEAETEILKKKKATVLISPSDYLNFNGKKTDFDSLIFSGLNLIIGTGYTGSSIFSELKILSTLISKKILDAEMLLKTAIYNPSLLFGISNITGKIERTKSADMIILSMKNLRNAPDLPEISSGTVSEFIIQNLSEKDITEIILRGEIIMKDGMSLISDPAKEVRSSEEISKKMYSEGKYLEFREKYMMRGRVDLLTGDSSESADTEKEEIFVDMNLTGDYTGEGEFTILGIKKDEFEIKREEVITEDINMKITEIVSLDNGINLLGNEEESVQILSPAERRYIPEGGQKKSEKEKNKTVKVPEIKGDEIKISFQEEVSEEKIEEGNKTDVKTDIKTEVREEFVLKKKFKFGFGDDDKAKND